MYKVSLFKQLKTPVGKKFTWLVVLVLFAAMVLPFAPSASAAQSTAAFKDLKGHWAAAQINSWLERGLVAGYEDGTFRPNNPINRAEFVTLVNRAFDFTATADLGFKDIKGNEWFANEIAKAKAAGYISGYEDQTFRPYNFVTRQEAAAMIASVLNLAPSSDSALLSKFKDASAIASWSKNSVSAVVTAGIMGGYPDGTFGPVRSISRAETVVVLDRSLGKVAKATVFDQAGTYGPATGTQTISGDVTIAVAGVTLQNTVITGNLTLAEGIGEGSVNLKNVTVKGETIVKGGGANSVVLENCDIPKLIVSKEGVRIVAQGSTTVTAVRLETGAILVSVTTTASFGTVTVTETVPADALITLDGNFDKVEVAAPEVKIEVKGGTITNLVIDAKAKDAVVDLAEDATVDTLTVNAKAEVTGQGTIETAKINADGAVITPKPTNTEVAEGVTAIVAGKEVTSGTTTPSTGGGGGGAAVISVSAISVNPTTMTLKVGETGTITATVEPDNATNKKVNWSSDNEAVATVDADGKVTAKAKGIAYITATSVADSTKSATCKVIVADNWSDVADTTWYNATDQSFTISTAEQLAGLAVLVNRDENPVNFSDKTIILDADIDLLGLEWVPIGYAKRDGYAPAAGEPSFQGVFDGKSKTISNLKITPNDNTADGSDEYAYGLIGCMTKGSVRDLTINNPQIDGTGYSNGAVVGFLSYGYSIDDDSVITIENCTVVGGKIKGYQAAGGIIGRLIGSRDVTDKEEALRIKVVNCENRGTAIEVTSNNAAGGIVGNQYRTNSTEQVLIKDCVNSGNVTSPHMAGGIAGQIANGTLDGGTNTGTIVGGYTAEKGFYNGGHLIGYSTGAKIKNVKDLFDLKNIFETGGGMPIYIELTGDITATGYKGEKSGEAEIDSNSITMKNCRFLDFSGDTTLTVAEGKTIYLYTGYNNTVRGEEGATLTIEGEGNVNVGADPGQLKHFYKDNAGTEVAADESGNVIKGKYTLVVKSGDNTDRNQEIWVDATAPTLVSLTAYVYAGEIETQREAELVNGNWTLNWTVGETVTEIIALVSEPVRLVDGANAVVTMSGGTIPEGTVYGTIAVDEEDPTKIIITPNSGNETAGLAGTFTFTVAAGVIKDLAGNENAAVSITLNVQDEDGV